MTVNDKTRVLEDYRPTVVDLFSGAGGTGLGFKQAGFRILGAVEVNRSAAKTYEFNLKVNVTQRDIRDLAPEDFRHMLGLDKGQLDVLVGCPPCQGFSRFRNGTGQDDPRNDLVLRYLDYVREFMPRYVLFENVPGLIRTNYGKDYYDKLTDGLKSLSFTGKSGYSLREQEVNVADYGVAQHRKRIIVIGGRDGLRPPFPDRTHTGAPEANIPHLKPWRKVEDEIKDLPALEAGQNGEDNGKFPNHIASATGEKVLRFISAVPQNGGSRTEVAKHLWLRCHIDHPDGYRDVYGRAAWGEPSNTITSGCTNPSKGRFVHPEQNRAFTPREAACLQSFPRDYIFLGDSISQQIGNAVPPILAHAIAEALYARLQQIKLTE